MAGKPQLSHLKVRGEDPLRVVEGVSDGEELVGEVGHRCRRLVRGEEDVDEVPPHSPRVRGIMIVDHIGLSIAHENG